MSTPAPDIHDKITSALKEAFLETSTFVDEKQLTAASKSKLKQTFNNVSRDIGDAITESSKDLLKDFGPEQNQTPESTSPPSITEETPSPEDKIPNTFTPPEKNGIMDNNTQGTPSTPVTEPTPATQTAEPPQEKQPNEEPPSDDTSIPKNQKNINRPTDDPTATPEPTTSAPSQATIEEQRKRQFAEQKRYEAVADQKQGARLATAQEIQNQQQQQQAQIEKKNAIQGETKKLKFRKRCSCCMSCLTPASGCLLFPLKLIAKIMVYLKKFTIKELTKRKIASTPSKKK